MAMVHQKMERQRNPVWMRLKEGDLVLVWNTQLEKNLSQKLRSRWLELQCLVKINPSGVSGQVCEVYGDKNNQRRIHLDDMKVYYPWSDYLELVATYMSISYTRDAMKFASFPG
jgi:hypothetical protein